MAPTTSTIYSLASTALVGVMLYTAYASRLQFYPTVRLPATPIAYHAAAIIMLCLALQTCLTACGLSMLTRR